MIKNTFGTLIVAVLFAVLLTVAGTTHSRAETETTQTTTTTTKVEGNGGNFKTVKTEKTETLDQPEQPVEKEERHSSLVGSFFGFLGNVIAFPFRVIGGVLKAIF